jgi:hypothetical protein
MPEGEQNQGDAGTHLAVAKSNSGAAAGVSFADVAAVEFAVVGRTDEFAVVSRLTKILADPSIVGFEVESPSRKRRRLLSLDNTIVVEEVPNLEFNVIINGATPNSPVCRYIFVVDVLPCDPLTDWVPVKVISITREEALCQKQNGGD